MNRRGCLVVGGSGVWFVSHPSLNYSTLVSEGKVHILGKGKLGNGLVGVYKLTDSSQVISEATLKVIGNVDKYYGEMGVLKEIKKWEITVCVDK